MSVATILLLGIGILVAMFLVVFVKDLVANKNNLEQGTSYVTTGIIGAVVNFFDTLGIGSFAPLTALLRAFKQTEDRLIPGTLNVSCTIPVCYQAYLFISNVEVDPITLATMLIASAIGAYFGAGIVSKLPTNKVQVTVGIALLVTGTIFVLQLTGVFPGGGEAMGLTGAKLIFAIVMNCIFGALMTAGIGLYALCMALVLGLGMSPLMAFPIMMGSCAYLMPVASMKFVREGAYNRKASLMIALGGMVGVYIAYTFISGLDLTILKWIVVGVMVYTASSLFMAAKRTKTQKAA